MCAKEHPFVVWMDTSLRFRTSKITYIIDLAKTNTVLAAEGSGFVATRTHSNMFNFLKEDPNTFESLKEFQAGFIIYYGNEFGENFFMRPWISCALTFGCMVPDYTSAKYLSCPNVERFHACHRFEQSMMSILLYRLFYKEIDKHVLKTGVYTFCTECME